MNRDADNQWINIFEIKETANDAKRGHTIYKVVSKLFPRNSIEAVSEIVVWKRFNDFKQLHKSLSRLHQNLHLKGVFPKLPDSKIFGRFNEHVIEERRKAALLLLEFAAKHPPLLSSSFFVKFFENATVNLDSEIETLPKPLEPRKLSETESNLSFKSDFSEGSSSDISPQFCGTKSCTDKLDEYEKLEAFDPFIKSNENDSSPESLDNWMLVVETTSVINDTNNSQNNSNFLQVPGPLPNIEANQLDEPSSNSPHKGNAEKPKETLNSPIITNSDTYLVDAATLISQAQQHENDNEFEAAFESYKCAVGILLQGAKNEVDAEKREMVRRKTVKYLARAEEISEKYLDKTASSGKWAPDSPYKLFSHSITPLRGESILSLRHLKVIDVISCVQLVCNIVTAEKFIVKVYRKPVNSKDSPVFPTGVPNMVKLYKVYETDYAYFLLLQFVSGGRLWDYVYREGFRKLSPCADCTFSSMQNTEDIGFALTSSRSLFSVSQESDDDFDENSLAKLDSYCGSISSIDSVGLDDSMCCESYIEMCSNYANMNCKFEPGSFSIDGDKLHSKETVIKESKQNEKTKAVSNTVQPAHKSKFSMSLETLGIGSLLQKAKVMLKNADDSLRTTKQSSKKMCNKECLTLKLSQSEINLAKIKKPQASEVFHQFENNRLMYNRLLAEEKIRKWLLQIIEALDHLHSHGVCYVDLNPNNLLIDESEEQIYLTYKCKLDDNELISTNYHCTHSVYIAPEVYSNSSSISQQVDWWSLGVIAYELLTSRSLQSYYPRGVSENCDLIYFPHFVTPEAKDLVVELLQLNPKLRLGRYGTEDIKTHPFFLKLE